MTEFTHFNQQGRATMVDVSEKEITARKAVAKGRVSVNKETFDLIESGGLKKGDVLTTAQIGGIMAGKKTGEIIPMCHPIALDGLNLSFSLNRKELVVEIEATAKCNGPTGVEMEALTAVSVAALTIYDMCKSVQKDICIESIYLVEKSGGKSGLFQHK